MKESVAVRVKSKNQRRLTLRQPTSPLRLRTTRANSPADWSRVNRLSDTQAYKQFGNAAVVPLVAFVAQALVEQIRD